MWYTTSFNTKPSLIMCLSLSMMMHGNICEGILLSPLQSGKVYSVVGSREAWLWYYSADEWAQRHQHLPWSASWLECFYWYWIYIFNHISVVHTISSAIVQVYKTENLNHKFTKKLVFFSLHLQLIFRVWKERFPWKALLWNGVVQIGRMVLASWDSVTGSGITSSEMLR